MATLSLSAARIFSISSCSFMKSSLSSLFKLTTAIGSIKRVEPVDDWSCIMPGTLPLASAFTGRQYLPSRMVTTASCRYVLVVLLFMSLVSCAWILSFMPRMLFLILKSSGLASSAISSSDKMHLLISSQSAETGSIPANRPESESCFSLSMPLLP